MARTLRKDVLELLLRLCDREGIRLIPALQLSTPLPALEAKRREQDTAKSGIILADMKGRVWKDPEALSNGGEGVRYNPLHPAVQNELLQVVRELVDRYGSHPSSLVWQSIHRDEDVPSFQVPPGGVIHRPTNVFLKHGP